MTEDVADAILDWIDSDDEPREFGCESEYYATLQPPYVPKNAPLDTVEELLLVRGVTPNLLFGYDTNRNGVLDPHEQGPGDAAAIAMDPTMRAMVRGWAPYLTLYSAEKNVNAMGLPRINLNQDDMATLYDELSQVFGPEWATFIVAYRQNGPYDGEESAGELSGELDLSLPGETRITQVLDLVGKRVQARLAGGQTVILDSPFPADLLALPTYLPTLMDNCTANPSPSIPGRININQAPRAILLGIPGMTPELVDQIIETRVPFPSSADEAARFQHETWLLTEGILVTEDGEPDISTMRQLMPFVTAGGDVFRAQIVGYYQGAGAAARCEVVIDSTGVVPRVLFWRDLSHLGRGYPLEVLGLNLMGQY